MTKAFLRKLCLISILASTLLNSCDSADDTSVVCDLTNGENILWDLEGQETLCRTGRVTNYSFFNNTVEGYVTEEMVIQVFDEQGAVNWILNISTYNPDIPGSRELSEGPFEVGIPVEYAFGRAGNAGGGEAMVTFTEIDRTSKVVSGRFSGTGLIQILDGGIPSLGPVTGTFTGLVYD